MAGRPKPSSGRAAWPSTSSGSPRTTASEFFLINFTDLFGVQRSKLVPAQAIGEMQKTGAGFAGFATWLDMTPANSDMFSVPDSDSVIQLPWKPEVAWVAGDLMMDGPSSRRRASCSRS
jgi:glutamine synthetase